MRPEDIRFHYSPLDSRLAEALEHAGVGLAVAELSNRRLTTNRALAAMLGYAPEELAGRDLAEISHPEDLEADHALFQQLLAGQRDAYQLRKRYLHKQGHVVWGKLTMSVLRNAAGELDFAVAMVENIDEQVKAEQARARHAALLHAEMEAAIDGILVVDAEGRLLQSNRRFAELWQIPAALIEQGNDVALRDHVLPMVADPEGFTAQVRALYGQREARSHDTIAMRDGRVLDRYSAPALGPDGTYFGRIWYFRDVTEHVQAAVVLREQNQRLLELDRLKSSFVDAVSHELRTPLTSILGYAELLEDGMAGPLEEAARGYVDRIRDNSYRLSRLVDDLLDFARLEAGSFKLEPAETRLPDRIEEVLANLAPLADARGLTLAAAMPAQVPPVWADAGRVVQVLTNLVGNAIKFTPAGGRVTVRLEPAPEGLKVRVEDTGIGIASEHLARLFEKFYQVDPGLTREVGGAGLGLAITKALVETQGGTIGVESEPGRGSTFWFTLPVV